MRRRPAVLVLAAFSLLPCLPALAQVTPRPGEVVTTPSTVFVPAPGGQSPGTPAPGQVTPPRDAGPQTVIGTGVIRGRISDADTGLPIRRASVQLGQRTMRGEPRATSTDDQGRFEFGELPPGDYLVNVRKPGYASLGYGQRRWNETPRPLALRAGEVFEKCDVALQKGGVVTGRVVDEVGEPVLEANVRVMRQGWFRGRRRMTDAGFGTTNDLGVFRIFGLPPGDYFVQATMRATASMFSRDDTAVDYAPTYYPGTTDLASAQAVAVAPSQEIGADITLLPVRVTSISGQVLAASGRPLAGGRVMAMPQAEGPTIVFSQPRTASIKADGTFELTGLAPGTYVVSASASDAFFGVAGDREFAQQTISVAGEPIRGLTLALATGGIARGRVVYEGTPPATLGNLRIFSRPVDDSVTMMMGGAPPEVSADGTFEVKGLVGRRILTVSPSGPGGLQGWGVKAVLIGGRDVQDTGYDFAPGRTVSGVEIVLSQQFASIAGTVTDDRGQSLKDYSVLVVADDREKWFLPSMRWLKSARADQDGAFKVEYLAAGRYLVVAVDSLDTSTLGDPEEIEKLRAFATEVTVDDTEKRSMTLTIARP